jgi:hypothetical protein
MQLVHHIINYRLTLITEAENLIVPGQDGGRAGRGVDLNQLKLDWVTSEARRLRQRIIRIDIDFKNAFNSMSQTALWAVLFPCNHNPQSRGITGLLDMKRLLFALSLKRHTGHSVNPQPFDWLYLPRSLLLTTAFSKL